MHLLSPRREGGCLLCFLLNPTRLLASIREHTPEKCSFHKITAYNHSWNSRSSVIQTESHSEVDYTRDGDWLYFRIGRISYSVDSIQHPQAIMRITGFSLQAAHLLAQTPFLQLPSWSPETIQTPEGFKNSPRNTWGCFHGSKNAAGYGLINKIREWEKRGQRMYSRWVPNNTRTDQNVVRYFPQVSADSELNDCWLQGHRRETNLQTGCLHAC